MKEVFSDIFSFNNMILAAKKVAVKSSSGIDGVSAREAVDYVKNNYKSIKKELADGRYRPKEVLLQKIPKKDSSKFRILAIATMLDRVILRCIYTYLEEVYDGDFEYNSFGFRKGMNCHMAVNHIVKHLHEGYRYVISIDLKDCFGNISHDRILYNLHSKACDVGIIKIISKFLKVTYVENGHIGKNLIGCPQGNSISPVLANIILDDIDKELEKRGIVYARYADDITILAKSEKAALRIRNSISKFIEKKCRLPINYEKSGIHDIKDGFTMLGFSIIESSDGIHVSPKRGKCEEIVQQVSERCMEKSENIVKDLKGIVCGWISYYTIAEIESFVRTLDDVLVKNLKEYEKRFNTKVDIRKCCQCYEFYKKKATSK